MTNLDFEAWRCSHDNKLFCPDEGCSLKDGCARDRGWLPGMAYPMTTQAAESPSVQERLRSIAGRVDEFDDHVDIHLAADEIDRLTALVSRLLAHDGAEECQECAIGKSDAWKDARAFLQKVRE